MSLSTVIEFFVPSHFTLDVLDQIWLGIVELTCCFRAPAVLITLSICKVYNVHQITLELKGEWNNGWTKELPKLMLVEYSIGCILFFKRISCFGIGQSASSKRLLELVIS